METTVTCTNITIDEFRKIKLNVTTLYIATSRPVVLQQVGVVVLKEVLP